MQPKLYICHNLALNETVLVVCGRTKFTPGEEEARGHGAFCQPGKYRRTQCHCGSGRALLIAFAAVDKRRNEVISSKNINMLDSQRAVSQTEAHVTEIRQ